MLTSTAQSSSVQRLISRIERDISSGAMASGEVSGTESELCAYYGVSPAIFRQAARLLEASDLAAMRRGHRGGLVVHGYSLDGAAKTIATFLELTGTGVADIAPMSGRIFAWAVRVASDRVTLPAADALRRGMADIAAADTGYAHGQAFVAVVQRLTAAAENPVIALAHRVALHFLFDVTAFEAAPPETFDKSERKLRRLVEAVVGGDMVAAGQRVDSWISFNNRHLLNPAHAKDIDRPLQHGGSSRTLSDQLARRILSEIRRGAWSQGQRLGSEPELMARYGVSRATFRQAVRLLEQYGAVQNRRGPGGGLFVSTPSPEHVLHFAAEALAQSGVSRAHVAEASRLLVGAAFDQWLEEHPDNMSLALGLAGDYLEDDPQRAIDIVAAGLAQAGERRYVAFMLQLIVRLEASMGMGGGDREAAAEAFGEIVASFRQADPNRAKRALMTFVATFGVSGAGLAPA